MIIKTTVSSQIHVQHSLILFPDGLMLILNNDVYKNINVGDSVVL